jgi:hypothetical protein
MEEAQREGRAMEGGEEVGSRQKSLEKLRGSPLLLHRRQQEMTTDILHD